LQNKGDFKALYYLLCNSILLDGTNFEARLQAEGCANSNDRVGGIFPGPAKRLLQINASAVTVAALQHTKAYVSYPGEWLPAAASYLQVPNICDRTVTNSDFIAQRSYHWLANCFMDAVLSLGN
jgi:hypothetical protein